MSTGAQSQVIIAGKFRSEKKEGSKSPGQTDTLDAEKESKKDGKILLFNHIEVLLLTFLVCSA